MILSFQSQPTSHDHRWVEGWWLTGKQKPLCANWASATASTPQTWFSSQPLNTQRLNASVKLQLSPRCSKRQQNFFSPPFPPNLVICQFPATSQSSPFTWSLTTGRIKASFRSSKANCHIFLNCCACWTHLEESADCPLPHIWAHSCPWLFSVTLIERTWQFFFSLELPAMEICNLLMIGQTTVQILRCCLRIHKIKKNYELSHISTKIT